MALTKLQLKFREKKKILIYATIFVLVIFLLSWLVRSVKENRYAASQNFNTYYAHLLSQCGQDKKIHDCCFDSVSYMAANNYILAPTVGCPGGYKVNVFNCEGSYKWCEIIR